MPKKMEVDPHSIQEHMVINTSNNIRGGLSDYNVPCGDINSSKNNRGDLSAYAGLCGERGRRISYHDEHFKED